jgi:uncharacterized protein YajQ (UPF0234 family)
MKTQAINFNEIISNHHLHPEITRDIQKSSQKLIRSKTLKILTPIKSDNINSHENIFALQW